MPVEETMVLAITCDNPACPGNELDPADRAGWTFINREVYGLEVEQFVYCSQACAGTIQEMPPPGEPIELPPPDPGL